MRNVSLWIAVAVFGISASSAQAAAPVVFEAESSTVTTGLSYVYSDSAASTDAPSPTTGQFRKIVNNGSVSFTYTGARAILTVRAKPDFCEVDPVMQVTATNSGGTSTLGTVDVDKPGWNAYQFSLPTSTSTTIKVAFTNDYGSSSCNRNLSVDAIAVSDQQSSGTTGASLTRTPSSLGTVSGSALNIGAAGKASFTTSEPIASVDLDARTLSACGGVASARVTVDGTVVVPATSERIYWTNTATQRLTLPAPLWVGTIASGVTTPHTVEVELVNPLGSTIHSCARTLQVSQVRLNSSVITNPPATPGTATLTYLNTRRGYAGDVVEMLGTNLVPGAKVKFGSAEAAILRQEPFNSTQAYLEVAVPAGTLNSTIDVTIESPYGNSVPNSSSAFTYIGAPTITSVSPSSGNVAGGTSVTLMGTNLDAVTSVKFGATSATIGTKTPTSLTVTSPAGAAGTVDISATNSVLPATSSNTAADNFTYFSTAPTISGLNPANGSTEGNTVVRIAGTNLGSVNSVKFGTTSAAILSTSATEVFALSPAKAVGGTDVSVTTTGNETSANTSADNYTYNAVASGTLWFTPNYNTSAVDFETNTPSATQWQTEQEVASDRLQIVTGANVPLGDNFALRPYGALQAKHQAGDLNTAAGTDNPRAEVSADDLHRPTIGEEIWVDYWLYVPETTSFLKSDSSSYTVIFQWKGPGPGSPVVALEIDKDDEHFKIISNQYCHGTCNANQSRLNLALGALTKNKWTHVTLGVKFGTSPSTGWVTGIVDGVSTSLATQTLGTSPKTGRTYTEAYPKQGLYQSGADQSSPNKVIYNSPIRIASTQARAQQR